jgi:hypothetical protein
VTALSFYPIDVSKTALIAPFWLIFVRTRKDNQLTRVGMMLGRSTNCWPNLIFAVSLFELLRTDGSTFPQQLHGVLGDSGRVRYCNDWMFRHSRSA